MIKDEYIIYEHTYLPTGQTYVGRTSQTIEERSARNGRAYGSTPFGLFIKEKGAESWNDPSVWSHKEVYKGNYIDSSKEVIIPNAFSIPKNISYNLYPNKILYSGRIDKIIKQTYLLTNIINNEYEYNFIGYDFDNLLENKKCNYYGYVTNTEKYYKENSVNIITTLYDGFCRSCVEGMMYGLPAIGFKDSFIMRKHITHGVNGLLVEERTSSCLKHTIDDFFKNHNTLEMKKNAYKYAGKYDKERIFPLWKNLIDDTIKDCK